MQRAFNVVLVGAVVILAILFLQRDKCECEFTTLSVIVEAPCAIPTLQVLEVVPSVTPTQEVVPTSTAIPVPTEEPTQEPPTSVATVEPTQEPTQELTQEPTPEPTVAVEDKKKHCNKGEGNGGEGCDPGNNPDKGNDDED